MRRALAALLLLAVGIGIGTGGCGSAAGTQGAAGAAESSVQQTQTPEQRAYLYLANFPGLGLALISSREKTIYRFSRDVRGAGSTHCYGACAEAWEPVLSYLQPHGESRAFHPTNFGTIERSDGLRQATYDGWPLYTYGPEGTEATRRIGARAFGGTWYALRVSGKRIE